MGFRKCCVISCKNTTKNNQFKFYSFPTSKHKLIQREEWIYTIIKQNGYDCNWNPTRTHLICSAHFIGDKKSESELSPNYVPTIFSSKLQHKLSQNASLNRHERFKKRYLQKRSPLIVDKKPISSVNELKNFKHLKNLESEVAANSTSENVMVNIMDIKVEIKRELEEYDNGFSSADVQYMQSELSTAVDIIDVKDVKKEKQEDDSDNKPISSVNDLHLNNLEPKIAANSMSENKVDIKVEIKKELEEYDNGVSGRDIQYMQSELSTEVDIIDVEDVKKEKQDHSGFPQINNKLENEQKSLKCSYHKEQQISRHVEKTILNKSVKVQIGQNPNKCEICFKAFATAKYFKIHSRIHTGEKPYKCKICSKTFITSNSLKVHLRAHTGEKPYKCEICFKSFVTAHKLKMHLRTHTGEKPYKCEICFKAFATTHILKMHLRIHTGEKPYNCEICLQQFSQKNHLVNHIKVHTGEKNYNCEICLKQFSRQRSLKMHKKVHSGE
ncbi:unnamed protein product [Diabrotica balteata]|uniref:Uncharacterized protein n=1 Tax=Diabrotica balteata TaxID=107213 RepID=A0A9N9TCW3_DIABA|nr:unnamed protein product [Diabrotica balteata]